MIALLGRRDMPTDGVDDYCTFLGQALARQGHTLEKYRVEWARDGWIRALRQLSRDATAWRNKWVILQFTSLAWSRRGFPFGAWLAMRILRKHGVRTAVYYHEPTGFDSSRAIDRIRRACQEWVIRALYRAAERPIFADPLSKIPGFLASKQKRKLPLSPSVPAFRSRRAPQPIPHAYAKHHSAPSPSTALAIRPICRRNSTIFPAPCAPSPRMAGKSA